MRKCRGNPLPSLIFSILHSQHMQQIRGTRAITEKEEMQTEEDEKREKRQSGKDKKKTFLFIALKLPSDSLMPHLPKIELQYEYNI